MNKYNVYKSVQMSIICLEYQKITLFIIWTNVLKVVCLKYGGSNQK